MCELFDLLQGHVECWDCVSDQTLGKKNTSEMIKVTIFMIVRLTFMGCSLGRTSGGVFAGGVPSEVLDEALDGEGLTDSFEFLSASVAPLPFTWEHNHSPFNATVNAEYQDPPQGGSMGLHLSFSVCFLTLSSDHFRF